MIDPDCVERPTEKLAEPGARPDMRVLTPAALDLDLRNDFINPAEQRAGVDMGKKIDVMQVRDLGNAVAVLGFEVLPRCHRAVHIKGVIPVRGTDRQPPARLENTENLAQHRDRICNVLDNMVEDHIILASGFDLLQALGI